MLKKIIIGLNGIDKYKIISDVNSKRNYLKIINWLKKERSENFKNNTITSYDLEDACIQLGIIIKL